MKPDTIQGKIPDEKDRSLKIVSTGPSPWDVRILVGGHDLTHMMRRLDLTVESRDLPSATLIIEPSWVEVDQEVLLQLKALADARET